MIQVIMYIRGRYDPQFIQKTADTLTTLWQENDLDLVVIYDNSTSILCEVPTIVRILKSNKNQGEISMSSLSTAMTGSYFDVNSLFQHIDSTKNEQLILIEKDINKGAISSKIFEQLLKSWDKMKPSKISIPVFLKEKFIMFYQNDELLNSTSSLPQIKQSDTSNANLASGCL